MATLKDRLVAAYQRKAKLSEAAVLAAAELAKPEEALKQADAEIEALLAEQAAADRNNLIAELRKRCDAMEASIEKTPAVLTPEFARKWIDFCKECAELRSRLGLRTTDLPDHLLIKVYQGTFFPLFPKYVTKPNSIYLNKTFLQLFREYKAKFSGTETEISRLATPEIINPASIVAPLTGGEDIAVAKLS